MTIDRQKGTPERAITAWRRQPAARPTTRVPGTLGVTVVACTEGEASVALAGELDVAHAPRVERTLRTLVESGFNASIEASALSFIDAAGVAALIRARERATGLGRGLVIVSASEPVVRMLELTATGDLLSVLRPADRR